MFLKWVSVFNTIFWGGIVWLLVSKQVYIAAAVWSTMFLVSLGCAVYFFFFDAETANRKRKPPQPPQ